MNGGVGRLLTIKSLIPAPAGMLKAPFGDGGEKAGACAADNCWKHYFCKYFRCSMFTVVLPRWAGFI